MAKKAKKVAKPPKARTACMLKALKLDSSALDEKIGTIWPYTIEDPIDHIHDRCHPVCYPMARQTVRDRVAGDDVNRLTLAQYIQIISG